MMHHKTHQNKLSHKKAVKETEKLIAILQSENDQISQNKTPAFTNDNTKSEILSYLSEYKQYLDEGRQEYDSIGPDGNKEEFLTKLLLLRETMEENKRHLEIMSFVNKEYLAIIVGAIAKNSRKSDTYDENGSMITAKSKAKIKSISLNAEI